jgi:hypothetical protein
VGSIVICPEFPKLLVSLLFLICYDVEKL